MVLPRGLTEQVVEIAANTRINPNLPTQAFITDFIESGKYLDFLNYLCNLYRPKMDALNDALNVHFPGSFPVLIRGGFFSCISLKTIMTFPAFEPEQIKWGISRLKEVEDSLSSVL
jgi:DNA-binding transcriptional MocR family regulator